LQLAGTYLSSEYTNFRRKDSKVSDFHAFFFTKILCMSLNWIFSFFFIANGKKFN